MRVVFILRPSLPKYNITWNVSKVLTYLEGISVNDNLVHLKELAMKTVMLLSLLTGQRLQSLQLIEKGIFTNFLGNNSQQRTTYLKNNISYINSNS